MKKAILAALACFGVGVGLGSLLATPTSDCSDCGCKGKVCTPKCLCASPEAKSKCCGK